MKTLVIIPAYNEAPNIVHTVESLKAACPDVDYVVVNDCSGDDTAKICEEHGYTYLNLPINLGIGGGMQTGYRYAAENGYDIAIQIDGDGQHDSKYIPVMENYIKNEKYDMVIGSRFIKKTKYEQTFMRMLGNKILYFLIKLFTGKKIYDTTSGFRAVNRDLIKRFSENYPYDYPEPDTNLQVLLLNKKIIEIPVEMRKRTTGKSFASPLKSIQYMVKVILALCIARLRKN